MKARFLSLWNRINASYWFWPATFCLAAFCLALLTLHLDRSGMADSLAEVAAIVPARPDGASTMLQVIAGSMIGVAATVFSITIAAVAYASGTYGPRLLTNFMEDRGNQLSLATFIGTFVYAIMILRSVRGEDERPSTVQDAMASTLPGFVPQLSLLVATAMMLAAVGMLVFFLNHVPSSIRINVVLERIGERLIRQIRDRFLEEGDAIDVERPNGGWPVAAGRSGYVEVIDYSGLSDIAREHDIDVMIDRQSGDFVHPKVTLARYCGGSGADNAIESALQSCFVLSGLRTPQQDLRFLIDELVEIALRALSPGINDPFTAITALHWLGAATAQLGCRELARAPDDSDDEDKRRIHPRHMRFADYVGIGFGSARSAVATSPKAALAMYDAMEDCATTMRQSRVADILAEGERLIMQVRTNLAGPDLAMVEARHEAFAATCSLRG
ncbi:DUF2254 domain-containing protein [Croceicoccus sp. BE223]|uniref:DUF2254 domain-containing protein n=1 Tax=Croceicoccus sp. BE223 TaxID=2817716 RepID=UPI002857237F|nr:DUF2254 domain-containing protein [Croceicoccus sp. BE223]MDR7100972.1 putative membrane protein [Croceicoccus sp. BE223]